MRAGEHGNVFFYIFLAIALFAALSYAVSQGNRGSVQDLTSEQLRLRATEIMDYTETVSKSVAILRLRGTNLASLSFANVLDSTYGTPGTSPLNEVFNTDGGGVVAHDTPADAQTSGTAQHYQFANANAVDGVGTTCAAATCTDLLILATGLKESLCTEINDLLGVGNPSGTPPVDSSLDEATHFAGTMAYSGIIGDEASSAAIATHTAACLLNTAQGTYDFYRVLWAQ